MKKFWYTIIACFIIPFAVIGAIIYSTLYLLQLHFRTINIFLEKAMNWVDKHITENIKECEG